MSHTISAKKENGFKVEVFDYNGNLAHSKWYDTNEGAVSAAQNWERLVTMGLHDDHPAMSLTDDELLAELTGF